jgi:hypothetical protein
MSRELLQAMMMMMNAKVHDIIPHSKNGVVSSLQMLMQLLCYHGNIKMLSWKYIKEISKNIYLLEQSP